MLKLNSATRNCFYNHHLFFSVVRCLNYYVDIKTVTFFSAINMKTNAAMNSTGTVQMREKGNTVRD